MILEPLIDIKTYNADMLYIDICHYWMKFIFMILYEILIKFPWWMKVKIQVEELYYISWEKHENIKNARIFKYGKGELTGSFRDLARIEKY